jgi:hypothetical protein
MWLCALLMRISGCRGDVRRGLACPLYAVMKSVEDTKIGPVWKQCGQRNTLESVTVVGDCTIFWPHQHDCPTT